MLTKTQIKIMQLIVSRITDLFSINGIANILKMNVSLAHRAIKPLIKEKKLLNLNKQNHISLNYRENHDVLTYVEYMRRNELLNKPRNIDLAMCLKDFIDNFQEEAFVLLIFGSAVNIRNPGDIDILLILDDIKKTESAERFLHNISRNYELDEKLHIVAISYESVCEMLSARNEVNVMNEVLNKHIIVYGAEIYYRLIKKGRR
ncbi:MAG: hypothetical protein KAS15_05420 [Nanoarchaeota archaeon]|nr:hypothetical protein [Nanoarchaeota archaeon]MCK5629907.1 hypothetical protein [Nanoarchaeota archaeon]